MFSLKAKIAFESIFIIILKWKITSRNTIIKIDIFIKDILAFNQYIIKVTKKLDIKNRVFLKTRINLALYTTFYLKKLVNIYKNFLIIYL